MHSNIKRFVEEFDGASFRHSEYIVDGLRNGRILLHSLSEDSATPASQHLDVYEFRLKRLQERPEHTAHTRTLRDDVQELVHGLAEHSDEPCQIWIFTEAPHHLYTVWIGRESRTIFGCIRGVDDRLITPETRSELWGDLADTEWKTMQIPNLKWLGLGATLTALMFWQIPTVDSPLMILYAVFCTVVSFLYMMFTNPKEEDSGLGIVLAMPILAALGPLMLIIMVFTRPWNDKSWKNRNIEKQAVQDVENDNKQ